MWGWRPSMVVVTLLAGCGRLGFDGFGGSDDDGPGPDASAPSPDMISNLVAHWSFDDLTAGAVSESAGGHTATCVGGACPSAAVGVVGQAATFDGSHCLRVPTLDTFVGTTFTISAWIQLAGPLTGPVVVHENYGGCPSPEMAVSNGGLGVLQLNTADGHNEAWTVSAMSPSWHHVAVRWDGTAQRLYVDGACCTLEPQLAPVAASTAEFTLGCYPGMGTTFTGGLDEVRIYDRALTHPELAVLASEAGTPTTIAACTARCAFAPP